MAREIRAFSVAIPAGTTAASGWSAPLSMPPRVVRQLSVIVPPGPRGTVGFAIGSAGTPVIPYQPGEWIITDNEVIDWPPTDYIDSGSWTLFGYNTGIYDHTLQVRFQLEPTSTPSPTAGQPIPASVLSQPSPPAAPPTLAPIPPPTPFVTGTGQSVTPEAVGATGATGGFVTDTGQVIGPGTATDPGVP